VLFVQVGQRIIQEALDCSLAPVAPEIAANSAMYSGWGMVSITVGFFDRFFQGDGVEAFALAE